MDDGWLEGLRALASRGFEISVIHILAPDEADPELTGDLKLIDFEDASAVEITADYDLLARYQPGPGRLAGGPAALLLRARDALHPAAPPPAAG